MLHADAGKALLHRGGHVRQGLRALVVGDRQRAQLAAAQEAEHANRRLGRQVDLPADDRVERFRTALVVHQRHRHAERGLHHLRHEMPGAARAGGAERDAALGLAIGLQRLQVQDALARRARRGPWVA